MNTIDSIKREILNLYETNPNIHVNVTMSKQKINLRNKAAVIKGVYRNVFQIEDRSSTAQNCYTLQYTDVLTRNIEIIELPKF